MAKTQALEEVKTHLTKLAEELRNYGWTAEITDVNGLALKVINPAATLLRERVLCREAETASGMEFAWWWGQPIARAKDVDHAARVIMHVLRSVEYEGRS
jgi:hypothetical protein